MVDREVETVPPWLVVVLLACIIGIIILLFVSNDILKLLVFPKSI